MNEYVEKFADKTESAGALSVIDRFCEIWRLSYLYDPIRNELTISDNVLTAEDIKELWIDWRKS